MYPYGKLDCASLSQIAIAKEQPVLTNNERQYQYKGSVTYGTELWITLTFPTVTSIGEISCFEGKCKNSTNHFHSLVLVNVWLEQPADQFNLGIHGIETQKLPLELSGTKSCNMVACPNYLVHYLRQWHYCQNLWSMSQIKDNFADGCV